ncbi:glycosyltransferase [Candidatus Woesearchaeota archaeon]|nr:glycosyltransferase [Candidatus Woesearchaeota archaeon]
MNVRFGIFSNGFPLNKGDYVATFCLAFAAELQRQGHEVHVLAPNRDGLKEATGVDVTWFPWKGGEAQNLSQLPLKKPATWLKMASLLRNGRKAAVEFCKQHKIEHVMALWATPSGYFARHVKNELGIPYDTWSLGADIWKYAKYPVIKGITRKVLRDASQCYADGLALCDDVASLSGKECVFLPTSRKLNTDVKPAQLDADKTQFVFIGRYELAKGPDVLIEAVKRLVANRQDFHVTMFGVGTMESQLKQTITAAKLDNVISFNGFASSETVASYMNSADCALIPSRIESIPVIFSDAMQCACPVIVTNVGDMKRLVEKYKVGLVVEPENSAQLAMAMEEFIDKHKRNDYAYGTEKAAAAFDLTNNVKNYLARFK